MLNSGQAETPVLLGSQRWGEVRRTGETPVLLGSQPRGFEPHNMYRADAGSGDSAGIQRHERFQIGWSSRAE
jgi:hypothetical protein